MLKFILKAILFLFGLLPLKVHYFNAKWIAWLTRVVIRYRRADVLINLSRCYPDLQYNWIKFYEKEFYDHFAELIVEAIWFGACRNPERLRKAHIMEIANPELLRETYANAPSVMVMYSHTGNWELYGGIEQYNYSDEPLGLSVKDFCVVYRRLSSKIWDEIFKENRYAPIRDKNGYDGYVESRNLPRYVFKHKDEKKVYNVNTDQRPYFSAPSYMECQFMGRTVKTMSAAAALAAKFGMAVLYLNMNRAERGKYILEYTLICQDASQMRAEDIMQKYYDLLTRDLHRNPMNYLWTHRRFQQI